LSNPIDEQPNLKENTDSVELDGNQIDENLKLFLSKDNYN